MFTTRPGGKVEDLKSLNDEEVIELASNLTSGVPMATPVFDGATEAEIKGLLELADLPMSPVSRPSTTVVPAISSIATSRLATCTC